jgi:hypothetical protein
MNSYQLVDIMKDETIFKHIVIGKKISTNNSISKYYLYCQNEMNEVPKEIYIRIPRLRLIYNIANQKYSTIKIPIYPNWEITDKFVDFIKNIEEEIFNTLNKKKEMSSLISKKNGLLLLKTKLQDNVKITSNLNKEVTLNDFKINSSVDIVIHISYIWMKENKMGLSSQIYQIKYFAPPEQLDINFIDEPVILKSHPSEEVYNTFSVKGPPIHIMPLPIECLPPPPKKIVPEQIGIRMVPSIKDLQGALKKLKHVE